MDQKKNQSAILYRLKSNATCYFEFMCLRTVLQAELSFDSCMYSTTSKNIFPKCMKQN